MRIIERLEELGITLPAQDPPASMFESWTRRGNLLFLSGHIAKARWRALDRTLGRDLTTAELLVLVNSTPTFTESHLSPTARRSFCSRYRATPADMRAARSVWRNCRLGCCVAIELVAELQVETSVVSET